MNTQAGKSIGIALLMAAALIAALFAMGVFSATGSIVSAHDCATMVDDDGDTVDVAHSDDGGTDCGESDHDDAHVGIIRNASVTLSSYLPNEDTSDGQITATGVTMTIKFAVTTDNKGDDQTQDATDDISVTIPTTAAFSRGSGSVATVSQDGETVTLPTSGLEFTIGESNLDYKKGKPITVKITNLDNPTAPSAPDADPAITYAVTVQQGTAADIVSKSLPIKIGVDVLIGAISSTTPSAPVRIDINTAAANEITAGEDIHVTLKDFGVPSTISESSVLIVGAADEDYSGAPESVTVNGKKITLSLAIRLGDETTAAGNISGNYKIVFKQSAGITNPASRGAKGIVVEDRDDDDAFGTVTIKSKVSLDKEFGPRGTAAVVTAKGIGAGGATVYLVQNDCADQGNDANGNECLEEDDISLGNGTSSGGVVSVSIDTSSSDFGNGVTQVDENGAPADAPYARTDKLRGLNRITVVDGGGTTADVIGYFGVTPTIEVDEDAAQQGDELTVLVEDWFYDTGAGKVAKVTIGDETAAIADVEIDSDGDGEVEVIVPTTARLGDQELKVTGYSTNREGGLMGDKPDAAKGRVVIGALDIELDPSTIVLGEQFTVKVSGFSDENPPNDPSTPNIDESLRPEIERVKIGDIPLLKTTGGQNVSDLTIDTNGDFTNTFVVKATNDNAKDLKPGSYRVEVRDWSGRVAIGTLTFPEPEITIDPPVGRRGTTVTLVGSDFPAGRVVHVYYKEIEDESLLGAVLADSAGAIRMTFTVPSDAEIGEEQDIIAVSAANETQYKTKAKHSLPPQEIIVSPEQASAGGRLRIEGHNMPLFTLVRLNIANINVSGQGVETDGLGSFVIENVLVPQLKPGSHTVEAEVATQGEEAAKVRKVIQIVDIITRDSDDAFADLITNGTLTRVWHLDAATQTWSFYDPAPEFADFNTLTQVSSGQIVTIIMGAQDEFQGETLYVGSNNVAIE